MRRKRMLERRLMKLLVVNCFLLVVLAAMMGNIVKEKQELNAGATDMEDMVDEIEYAQFKVETKLQELDCIYTISEKYNIPPEVALAVMRVESNFHPEVSNGTCQGIMQINSLYHTADLFDLRENTEIGISILSDLQNESDNLHQVLGKYNRGKAGYRKYVSETGKEVTAYSEKVLDLIERMNDVK